MVSRSIFAALILSLCFVADPAKAGDGCFYAGYYGNYGAITGSNYNGQGINHDWHPYFAMYPPVYYSYIEPRSFGQSPYAYLPPIAPVNYPAGQPYGFQQPMAQQPMGQQQAQQPVRPLMVRNPYVTESVSTPPALPSPPPPSN